LAVVTKQDDITGIEDDVFMYFGMGCRNVSLIFLPLGYDVEKLKQRFKKYAYISDFHKYKNNYDYHKALLIMNNISFEDGDFFLLQNKEDLHSPISVINVVYYKDITQVEEFVSQHKEELQCVVADKFSPLSKIETVPFGLAQKPRLDNFADGVNTMLFLARV
ncbi:MAG: acyl-CoA reductase, partial [Bacteroidota bacterium]|nr:acyl-CoA reductase [Bacteroidota bacterium]